MKMESSETKCLPGGKEYSMCTDTGELKRESHPGGSLSHFNGAFVPVYLWPVILIFPGSESIFGITQESSTVIIHTNLSAKMDSSEKPMGR